jgi:hypothetical protein
MEPTSLNRGEGLVTELSGEVAGSEGEGWRDGGGGGRSENERISTVMWLMGRSNSALPQR